MKKNLTLLFMLVIMIGMLFSVSSVSLADEKEPSRTINVVYDDSGSMIRWQGEYLDTWCQAKYSMEVFAAMLGTTDTMNIYYMSDYETDTTSAPRIVLDGVDGAASNISKIHNAPVTDAGNTPFNSVRKAYADLTMSSADEKWLVILTDGAFEDGNLDISEVNNFLHGKTEDINVMYLAMGPYAVAIAEDGDAHIYYEEAKTNDQILGKITGICTRIFNSNRLKVDTSTNMISFDVPMEQLTVFAQGGDVLINGVTDENGTLIQSSGEPVLVKYSEIAATNDTYSPSDFVVDRNLVGRIITIEHEFDSGEYMLDVSGAETIEVYYKPNIDVAAYLVDSDGNEISDLSSIPAGKYMLEFGFVKAGTDKKVPQSELLGDTTFEATVINNGQELPQTFGSGDAIEVAAGSLTIDAIAKYLDYNSTTTHIDAMVTQDKSVSFIVSEDPDYTIHSGGIDPQTPITLDMEINGAPVSESEWGNIELPEISLMNDKDRDVFDILIQKSDIPGRFFLTPSITSGLTSDYVIHNIDYAIDYYQESETGIWSGHLDSSVKISDSRNNSIQFTLVQNPDFILNAKGFEENEYVIVEMSIEGSIPTEEEWQIINVPNITIPDEEEEPFPDVIIEKSDVSGQFLLYPSAEIDALSQDLYHSFNYKLEYEQTVGYGIWSGQLDATMNIIDKRNKAVSYSVSDNPTFTVTSKGLQKKSPIVVSVFVDGAEISAEEWEAFEVPTVSIKGDTGGRLEKLEIEKGDEPGGLYLYPVLPNGEPTVGTYKNFGYSINCDQILDGNHWSGELQETCHMEDTRAWWERNWNLIPKLAGLLLLLLIILGYVPGIKKYLPKMAKEPIIHCTPTVPFLQPTTLTGLVTIKTGSTIIPYRKQRGKIEYAPAMAGVPDLEVKAKGGRMMVVTNCADFDGLTNVTFNGAAVNRKTGYGAGVSIMVKTQNYTYRCQPNQ